ncbi:MAG: hypothetical protein AAGB18_04215 [Pseudomonadota bacterium]
MNPDLIFVIGVGIFALAIPAVINAFSTSGMTLKPALAFVVVGGSLIVFAQSQTTTETYSLTEIPKIVMGLFR